MRLASLILTAVLTLTVAVPALSTEVPVLITYQGRLTDDTGTPLNGSHNLMFAIYVDAGGITNLWTETRPGVVITDGLFEVQLGSITTFPANVFSGPIRYLGIRVDAGPEGRPLTPIVSVPYALHASTSMSAEGVADNAITSTKIVDHSILGQDLAQNGATSGQVLKWDGSNWIPAQDLSGASYWQSTNQILKPSSSGDTVDIGPYTHLSGSEYTFPELGHNGKLNITGGKTALRIEQPYEGNWAPPALFVGSDSAHGAIYSHIGLSWGTTATTNPVAIVGSARGDRAYGGGFFSHGFTPTLLGHNWGSGPAFWASAGSYNDSVCARFSGGRGLRVESYRIRSAHLEAADHSSTPDVILAVDYSGGSDELADHIGVKSTTRVDDFWGIGGYFEGGYMATRAVINGTGSNTYYGVKGEVQTTGAGACYAMHGTAASLGYNYALFGTASGGTFACGVYGTGTGAANNWAGYFDGNINVTGSVVKSTSLTRTDHPLDPDNKYLQTASVESSEMLNVYSGNVTTDPSGSAIVTLPDYVQACNTDFRYQLTVIGDFAQAIIANEISGNQFTIRTDKPNIKVSWQVTGLRNDRYAQSHPVEAELAKATEDRGKYVHPELFGKGQESRVGPPPPDEKTLAEKNRKIDETARTAIGKQPLNLPAQRAEER